LVLELNNMNRAITYRSRRNTRASNKRRNKPKY